MGIDFTNPETGFRLPQKTTGFFALPRPDMSLLDSFNRLVDDPYAKNCNRSRRFVQYKAFFNHAVLLDEYCCNKDAWTFERLPLRPFIQSYQDNKLVGGIPRYFAPVEADFTPLLRNMLDEMSSSNRAFQIDINQYRVTAEEGSQGISVPEGIHRDGRPIVAVAVYRRDNIEGAELSLYPNDSDEAFAKRLIEAGYGIVFDDRVMRHNATPIKNVSDQTIGIRDYVAINFTPWQERRYGPAYEASVLAQGQVVDESRVEPFCAFDCK